MTRKYSQFNWKRISTATVFAFLACTQQVSAQSTRTVVVKCRDAHSNDIIPCSTSVIPPSTRKQGETTLHLDLNTPIITFEIRSENYLPREITANVAGNHGETIRLDPYLSKRSPRGYVPTLDTVNLLKASVTRGEIDRALSIAEYISAADPSLEDGSTFQVRFLAWRMSALYKSCTTLKYDTCEKAKAAITDLKSAVQRNPRDFQREKFPAGTLDNDLQELDVAQFNNNIALANWYYREGRYQQALKHYEDALAELRTQDSAFMKRARINQEIIIDNIKLIHTKIAYNSQDNLQTNQ